MRTRSALFSRPSPSNCVRHESANPWRCRTIAMRLQEIPRSLVVYFDSRNRAVVDAGIDRPEIEGNFVGEDTPACQTSAQSLDEAVIAFCAFGLGRSGCRIRQGRGMRQP